MLADNVLEALWFGEDDSDAAEAKAAQSAAAELASTIGLKPFPAVAHELIGMLDREDYALRNVVAAFDRDPGLASRVLRLSNSGFFHTQTPVTSVRSAIVRLGAQNVRDLVAAAAVHGLFEDAGEVGQRLLEHAIATGAIARQLCLQLGLELAPEAYVAGLLHDIGKLLMLQAFGEDYDTSERYDNGIAVEREARGYDHALLGAVACAEWNLPAPFADAIRMHHDFGRALTHPQPRFTQLVAILRLADRLEHAAYDHELTGAKDPEVIAFELARRSDASYLQAGEEVFLAAWDAAIEARFDARSAA